MKRIFILLLLLAISVVGLGFYLGWFRVSTDQTGEKINTTITVDQEKIRQDVEKAKEKVRDSSGSGAAKNEDDR